MPETEGVARRLQLIGRFDHYTFVLKLLLTMLLRFFLILFLSNTAHLFLAAQETVAYEVFEPGVISLPDINEGAPSITADGNTLVFTRYQSYGKQVPYIGQQRGSTWTVSRWPVVDTLYNLAISPDGQRIVYKVRYEDEKGASYATFRTDRQTDGSWAEPIALEGALFPNAGYFRIAVDGTLYMYINNSAGNPKGIYTAEPLTDGGYTSPEWLSDAVSAYTSTTYTPIPNERENKLIVNRAGISSDAAKEQLGPRGLYLYQKYNGQWDTGTPITGIPYTFYAAMTPDDRMLFVEEGDLYEIDVADLNISFSDRSTKNSIRATLDAMEEAYAQKNTEQITAFYDRSGRIFADGKLVARGYYGIRDYWNNPRMEPVGWKLTPYIITRDPEDIYNSLRWQELKDKPVRITRLEATVDPDGFYQFGRSDLTYLRDGQEYTDTMYFLLHWTEKWGKPRILIDSY